MYYRSMAFINKWNKPINSVNPSVTEAGEAFLLAMDGDRVVWRLADLILLRAECQCSVEDACGGGQIWSDPGTCWLEKYSGSKDPEVLRKEIFYERERELFGEGQRYFDIVRNGYYREQYPYKYPNTSQNYRKEGYLLSKQYAELTDDDIKNGALYLPVGRKSLDNNTVVKQNIYWLWHQE